MRQNNSFDEDELKLKIDDIKAVCIAMEESNKCISNYARTISDFYTLWSLLVLHRDLITDFRNLADKYLQFMENVLKIKEENLNVGTDEEKYYAKYSTGATTDLKPREARLTSLRKALLE